MIAGRCVSVAADFNAYRVRAEDIAEGVGKRRPYKSGGQQRLPLPRAEENRQAGTPAATIGII